MQPCKYDRTTYRVSRAAGIRGIDAEPGSSVDYREWISRAASACTGGGHLRCSDGRFAGNWATNWRSADGNDWMAVYLLDQRADRGHRSAVGGGVRAGVEGGACAGL